MAKAATGDTLASLQAQLKERLRSAARLVEAGVRLVDPATTYVEPGVRVGSGTEIRPNTAISGRTSIGAECIIGPNAVIADSQIGDGCVVTASVLEGAVVGDRSDVGPFSHLRPASHLEEDVHVGNFVEVKAARLGRGTRVGHFSYVGDAEVGQDVNIGAGTVTCNYDGEKKSVTFIGDRAFIGSDTMLVAPVRVGAASKTGAGAVVTEDVPDGATVAGVPARSMASRRDPQAAKRQVRRQGG